MFSPLFFGAFVAAADLVADGACDDSCRQQQNEFFHGFNFFQ